MPDYQIEVCDPRSEFWQNWRFEGVKRKQAMPDDFIRASQPDARAVVVALTYDPKLDDMALMEALTSQAFYVGALGSKLNNDKRRHRLAEHFELTAVQLTRCMDQWACLSVAGAPRRSPLRSSPR